MKQARDFGRHIAQKSFTLEMGCFLFLTIREEYNKVQLKAFLYVLYTVNMF
jgi:hypothetical protein